MKPLTRYLPSNTSPILTPEIYPFLLSQKSWTHCNIPRHHPNCPWVPRLRERWDGSGSVKKLLQIHEKVKFTWILELSRIASWGISLKSENMSNSTFCFFSVASISRRRSSLFAATGESVLSWTKKIKEFHIKFWKDWPKMVIWKFRNKTPISTCRIMRG